MNTPNTKQNYKQIILEFVKENYEVSPIEIITKTGISQQTVHNNLKTLLEEGEIVKKGSGLNVVYFVNMNKLIEKIRNKIDFINEENQEILKRFTGALLDQSETLINKFKDNFERILDNFILITADGERFNGLEGFDKWCKKQKLDIVKTLQEYNLTLSKYQKFSGKNNLIDATKKFILTFPEYKDLEKVYYCDFYAIERFGKTKLGNLMFYGKQSQNLKLIKEVCEIVKPTILKFIKENNINAVAFVPPTISREVQFMSVLQRELNLNIPIIKLKKLVNDIAVQQKTIKLADDRIINAENIVVEMNPSFENVLILDDAVGSGSTFAVVAKKLRLKKVATGKIYAIAIVGSPNGVIDDQKKGFEVINEV
jgi:DNA-binding MarR family transcriptional regulator